VLLPVCCWAGRVLARRARPRPLKRSAPLRPTPNQADGRGATGS